MCKQSVFLLVPICLALVGEWSSRGEDVSGRRKLANSSTKSQDGGAGDGGRGGALHRRRHPDDRANDDRRPGTEKHLS